MRLSEYVEKEIKGFSYSSDGSGNITYIELAKYRYNNLDESHGLFSGLQNKYGDNFSNLNVLQQFHTHPNGILGATESDPRLSDDVTYLQSDKPQIPNASFIILCSATGETKPKEYYYTHEYIPSKP